MSALLQRSPAAVWRSTAHVLVVAVPPGPPVRVTGSAALVWAGLAAPLSLDDLVAGLVASTGADAAAVRRDVTVLIDELVSLGAVERQG